MLSSDCLLIMFAYRYAKERDTGAMTVFLKSIKDKELTKKEVEHIQCEVYSEMCFKMYKCQDSEMEEFWNWLCEKNK